MVWAVGPALGLRPVPVSKSGRKMVRLGSMPHWRGDGANSCGIRRIWDEIGACLRNSHGNGATNLG